MDEKRLAKLLEETELQKELLSLANVLIDSYKVPSDLVSKFERVAIQRHHEIMNKKSE